jgi:hypothetical protein
LIVADGKGINTSSSLKKRKKKNSKKKNYLKEQSKFIAKDKRTVLLRRGRVIEPRGFEYRGE